MLEFRLDALDSETYAALRAQAGWMAYPEAQVRRALDAGWHNLAAFADGRPVAMGRLVGDGVYFTLCDVVVAPDWQGRGVGTEIVRQLLALAEDETPPGGRVSVQLIAVAGKEPFYERLGFRALPNQWSGAGMRKIFRK